MVKDVNPQFLTFSNLPESAANTFTEASQATPVVHSLGNNKALVMEILKIFMQNGYPDFADQATTYVSCSIHRQSKTSTPNLADPDTVMSYAEYGIVRDTGATDATYGILRPDNTKVWDFTDGNGNGLLYAAKNIFMSITGGGNSAAKSVQAKILYRMKMVSTEELLGLIQD